MDVVPAISPSPLRWRDLAEMMDAYERSHQVNATLELAFGLHATRGWCCTVTLITVPSVFSPHWGRKSKIVVTKQAYLGPGYSLPQLIWKAYWEASQKLGLLWPIAHPSD